MNRLIPPLLALALVLPLTAATAEGPADDGAEFQIVNGTAAPAGAYPWMVAVGNFAGQNLSQFCGGSLIAANWVLTAAHCLRDGRNQPTTTAANLQFRVNTTNWTTGGETLQADQIVVHPNYNPATTDNDIALVRTTTNSAVTPVQFARAGNTGLNDPPTQARVIGYGAVGTGQPGSSTLLQVDVPMRADGDCAGYGQYNATTQVCAGSPTQDQNNPGNDSCQGDSGGPLFAPTEQPIQIGVVSYGGICGVGNPGVYTQITTFEQWIDQTIGNPPAPGQPGPPDPGPAGNQPQGAGAQPNRIAGGDPNNAVDNAEAISQLVFRQQAQFGVLATSANFPDALGGSALASYLGPLLYVNAQGQLEPDTLAEFQRVVPQGGTIYILGGTAVIGGPVEATLQQAGFTTVRLAGAGRQQTARAVAQAVRDVVNANAGGQPPFNAMILAFEGNWPDAVAVGSLSGWFGIPILLTPTDALGAPAQEYMQTHQPGLVYILGGNAVISPNVRQQVAGTLPNAEILELQGPGRLQTGAAIAAETVFQFQSNTEVFDFEGEAITRPETIVAVNLRRDDAFAHVLAASSLVGNFGGVFAPLEGDGTAVDQSVLDSVCGLNAEVFAIGSTQLVNDSAFAPLQQASAGQGCAVG